jgi:hypothetical protein
VKQEFTLTLENVEYPVVAEGDTITVNGRAFAVEITDDGAVLVDGIAYDIALEGDTATVGNESYEVQVSGLAMKAAAPAGDHARQDHPRDGRGGPADQGGRTCLRAGGNEDGERTQRPPRWHRAGSPRQAGGRRGEGPGAGRNRIAQADF